MTGVQSSDIIHTTHSKLPNNRKGDLDNSPPCFSSSASHKNVISFPSVLQSPSVMCACLHRFNVSGFLTVTLFVGGSAGMLQRSVLYSDCCVLVSTACFTELFVVILYTLKALM